MKICIAAHDAGGSEIIAAWVEHHPHYEFDFFLAGPATRIFSRRLSHCQFQDLTSLAGCLQENAYDLLLTSCSWGTNLEREAWLIALKAKIPSATFLDGWCNFENGFILNAQRIRPDKVWIHHPLMKSHMFELGFAESDLEIHRNYYLEDIQKRILAYEKNNLKTGTQILYLSENISACEATYEARHIRRGYDEMNGLEAFLLACRKKMLGDFDRILIRPHPSETSQKFEKLRDVFKDLPLAFSNPERALELDIAESKKVAGMESIALAIALASGRQAFSILPKQALQECSLPHPELIRLKV